MDISPGKTQKRPRAGAEALTPPTTGQRGDAPRAAAPPAPAHEGVVFSSVKRKGRAGAGMGGGMDVPSRR